MIRVTLADKMTIREFARADQAKTEKDGSLVLYAWEYIGRYPCPEKKHEVVRFAPGKWASYDKLTDDKDTNE